MKNEMRITKKFLNRIKEDLYRPHDFAYERVGFVFCKHISGLLLASEYRPVPDDLYIEDRMVGARFSGEEIRLAMQRSLKTKEGVFHIHIHEHKGDPELSGVDVRSVTEIAEAIMGVNSAAPHGCILLSEDRCKTYILNKNHRKLEHIKTSIIKFPLTFFYPKGEFI